MRHTTPVDAGSSPQRPTSASQGSGRGFPGGTRPILPPMSTVARVERMEAEALRLNKNIALLDELVDIVQERFTGPGRGTIAKAVLLRGPGTRLLLYRGRDDELLGFSAYVVERHEVDGRVYGVMDNGTYIKPHVRGVGPRAVAYCLKDTLAFKLRNPRAALCFIGQAVSPAMYRLVHRYGASIHPRPAVPIPEPITTLVRQVMTKRGYRFVDDDPWRVQLRFSVRLRDEDRMRRFIERSDDPAVTFFVERNPGFFEGQWMVVYAPLGLSDLLRATGSMMQTMLHPGA